MIEKLASLAAGLAAGSYTNDFVLEELGGDKSLFDRVLGMAAGTVVGSVTTNVVNEIIESDDLLQDFSDSIEDFLGF